MDGSRFDELVRGFGGRLSRRQTLKAISGAVAAAGAAFIGIGDASAKRCRRAGSRCGRGNTSPCCSGVCCQGICCQSRSACAGDAGCCPVLQTCGDLCCPPENVGCTELQLPNGDIKIGCLCPEGSTYRDGACVAAALTCRSSVGDCNPLDSSCVNFPCCSGICDAGTCRCAKQDEGCADQFDCCRGQVCDSGVCKPVEEGTACRDDSQCGIGTFCDSGTCRACAAGGVSSDFCDIQYSCPWPMPGLLCDSNPDTGAPGFCYCCIPGENCVDDPCAPPCYNFAQGGAVTCNGL